MKIFIDGKIITTEDQPLIVILTEKDKQNILNMPEGYEVYSQYQKEKYSKEEIEDLVDMAKKKANTR